MFIPKLPELIAVHPHLELQLSTTDRRVDVVREGFDCVLRVGKLDESGLTAQRLGELPMMNCASPAYLKKHGTPRSLDDLERHLVVHYSQRFGAEAPAFEYRDGDAYRDWPMRSVITVNSTDRTTRRASPASASSSRRGIGVLGSIAAGDMVKILPQHPCEPLPVSLVHAHGRNVPRHVRVVMNWLADVLEGQLE